MRDATPLAVSDVTKRRLAINGRFLAQKLTGVQRYARCLITALDEILDNSDVGQNWSVRVVHPPGCTADLKLRHIHCMPVGSLSGHLWEQFQLPDATEDEILLSLCNTGPLRHRRHVVTIHDASVFAVPSSYSPRFRAWYRFLLPRLGARAAAVLTDSQFSAAELSTRAGISPSRLTVLPLGAEHILAVEPDVKVFERFPIRRPYLLTVASDAPHKNFDGMMSALALIDRRPFDVVIAGGGNTRVFGKTNAAELSGLWRIGAVTDAELRALYEGAACFLYPSLYEGFGLPPLEAMRCNVPVIVSGVASLPEVCGAAAAYCDPSNPADIAHAIELVMSDVRRQQELRCLGTAHVRQYTWAAAAKRLMDLLDAA